jgi:hypothetical protein
VAVVVDGTGVSIGGAGVAVGGTGVAVGGTGVSVGGTDVAMDSVLAQPASRTKIISQRAQAFISFITHHPADG